MTRNQWFTETIETIRTSGLTLIISTIRFFKTFIAELGFKESWTNFKSIWYIPVWPILISKIPVNWKFHLEQMVRNFSIRYNVSSCLNSDLLRELLCRINFVQCQK
jgi:hypothetical protein